MPETPPPPGSTPPEKPGSWVMLVLWLAVLLSLLSIFLADTGPSTETVSYSAMKEIIRERDVSAAVIAEHEITVTIGTPGAADSVAYRAVLPVQDGESLLATLENRGVEITARAPEGVSILTYLLPWLLIFGAIIWLNSRMTGGLGGARGPGNLFSGRFSKPTERRQRVTFDDVAGQDEVKREVSELVDFLREPDRFHRVGAEAPHGVLLMGPPGTGKTLLAKALAGEADVPFFSTSGSEFIEVFVGVGAGRVRKLFEAARKAAPAIIFIDELDSIGRTRGTGLGGGHDEREQTLNQILAELDGFGEREAVVVLAATNRPDVLDPALLRPGRFDRHVTLNLPDREARREILGIHARKLPLAGDAGLDAIAAGTPGFSGADLKNLLNEAAISAARRGGAQITGADLQDARDKVMMGTVRTLAIQPEEHHRLAVHEAGHAAVAYYTPGADTLYKVTIIPRGRSLGGTHMLSEEERHTLPEDYLRAQIVTLLAGRAAEKQLIGTVSSGADDDIKRATQLARSMVGRWGMDPEIGPIDLRQNEDHPFLGRSMAMPRIHAEQTAAQVDRAVMSLLSAAEEEATATLAAHADEVASLIAALEEKEVLDFEEIRRCLDPESATAAAAP
ncbi:ATP-dependent zinc metalloprotease FtsH [Rhodovulum sp. YNF3179]|uniref:ATP-dependent zinc metalloprotease FtsH n=1 Tax=Rhodovulum sp. YNF3179 TaxID=3425127 RepID=UPI003D34906B